MPSILPRIVAGPMVARESRLEQATAAERGDADDLERRRVKIRRNEELQRYGYTFGCEGCARAELGREHRAHSADGRARIEMAMRGDADPVIRARVLEADQ